MSAIESILSRAMSEPAFADMLFANPEQALTGYELTAEERTSLQSMSRADFGKLSAASPEERKSFSYQAYLAFKGTKQGELKGKAP
jgi:hypothetical protein